MERARSNNGLARIRVVGVGGGGCNAVSRMVQDKVKDVDLVAVNTDAQVLEVIEAHQHVQIGSKLTGGLGAGGDPDVGRRAAEESEGDLHDILEDIDMLFITSGMGGGTGTGAAPVIARLAQEAGVLNVGIVTRPFAFEGHQRAERCKKGIEELRQYVDTLITIPNDRLLKVAPADLPLMQAFDLVDDILRQGVQGITDLITTPGMINMDFADVETTMRKAGTALMGIGEGEGEGRTREAARSAITSPLLEGSVEGAQRVIMNITGGMDLTLEEVTEAAQLIREAVSESADIFFGTTVKDDFDGLKITLIATGFKPIEDEEFEELESEDEFKEYEAQFNHDRNNHSDDPPAREKRERPGDWDIPTFIRRRGDDGGDDED